MEPQYGTVSEIPPDPSPGPNSGSGLDYLLRCSHDQIKNKVGYSYNVMSVDDQKMHFLDTSYPTYACDLERLMM